MDCRKMRYTSEGPAERALRTLREHRRGEAEHMRSYFCRLCRGWHLGH